MPTINEYLDRLQSLNAQEADELASFRAEHGSGEPGPEPEPPGDGLSFTFPEHTIDESNDIAIYKAPFTGVVVGVQLFFNFTPGPIRGDRPDDFHGVFQLTGNGKWEQTCLAWHWYLRTSDSKLMARFKAPALVGREVSDEEKLDNPKTHVDYQVKKETGDTYLATLNGLHLQGPLALLKSPLTLQLGTNDNPPPEREVSWVGSTFSDIQLFIDLE